MELNATFIGQIIAFLILLWFFRKFITPVISAAIDERQKKIAEDSRRPIAAQEEPR